MTQQERVPGAVDLRPLEEVLEAHFHPQNYQDSLELIVGACQEAQHLYGYVPNEATELIAAHLKVSENRVYGLLTFYADFLTERPGKHTMLFCHGAACYVMGGQPVKDILEKEYQLRSSGSTSPDGSMTVQYINGCLGVCDMAPVALVDHDHYIGYLNPDRIRKFMDEIKNGTTPEEFNEAEE